MAEQRNASALYYHFGNRDGLIRAVVEKHSPRPDELRRIQRDLRARHPDPQLVVEAIVGRQREMLASPEGRDWVRIMSHAQLRAPVRRAMLNTLSDELGEPISPSTDALARLVRCHCPGLRSELVQERSFGVFAFITFMMAERARLIDDDEPVIDESRFIENLVDMAIGALMPRVDRGTVAGAAAGSDRE